MSAKPADDAPMETIIPNPCKNAQKGEKGPQYLAALSVCLGAVGAGSVLGWTSNVSDQLIKSELNEIAINDDSLGWIGSFAALGALVMCFPIGKICDCFGRKPTMLLITIPFVIGWYLIVFANSLTMIYWGRFISGMAGGAFCVSAPMYTSEIAEKEVRGTLGSYFQLLFTVGILIAYILGMSLDVQIYTALLGLIPIVFALVFFFQPETPVYRIKQGRVADARQILRRLRGPHYDVDGEIEQIEMALAEERANRVSLWRSLGKRATRRATLIGFGLMFFQQASGVNAVIFYTSKIFAASGSEMDPKVATIVVGVMQVLATFVSSLVIDRLGRRILLLASDVGMAVAEIGLGVFFSMKTREWVDAETVNAWSYLPVVSLCVFIVAFSLGFGPIPWMISSEVFPAEVKSIASSTCATFNWFIAFLITKYYNNIDRALGGDVAFYLFGGICILGTVFIFAVVPETKGKTLEQIQRELSGERGNKEMEMGVENKAYSA